MLNLQPARFVHHLMKNLDGNFAGESRTVGTLLTFQQRRGELLLPWELTSWCFDLHRRLSSGLYDHSILDCNVMLKETLDSIIWLCPFHNSTPCLQPRSSLRSLRSFCGGGPALMLSIAWCQQHHSPWIHLMCGKNNKNYLKITCVLN